MFLYPSPFTRKLRIKFAGRSSGLSGFRLPSHPPVGEQWQGYAETHNWTYSYGDSPGISPGSLLILISKNEIGIPALISASLDHFYYYEKLCFKQITFHNYHNYLVY